MKYLNLPQIVSNIKSQVGFTMIELLIVITILGILAVAVLSAINPVEQINRGRDTGSKSDAEQLINAIDRFNAFKGYYPWMLTPAPTTSVAWTELQGTNWTYTSEAAATCPVLARLGSEAVGNNCEENTDELKSSFVDRITDTDYNNLFIYKSADVGSSVYVCFTPQSRAFQTEAAERCENPAGDGLPSDLVGAAGTVCAANAEMVCLP